MIISVPPSRSMNDHRQSGGEIEEIFKPGKDEVVGSLWTLLLDHVKDALEDAPQQLMQAINK